MTLPAFERRLKALESRVAQLQDELRSVRKAKDKDWRRTIGVFTDNAGMKEVLQDALRLREADRRKARSTSAAKRSPRR